MKDMTRPRRRGWVLGCLAAAGIAGVAAATPEGDRLYQSALAKYGAKDYRGAIADAEAATTADPAHWQAWQLDGNARYAIGDKDGAVTVYRYSLRINPNNPGLQSFVDSLAAPAAPAQPAATAAQPAATATQPAAQSAAQPAANAQPVAASDSSGWQPRPRDDEPEGIRFAVYGGYQMVSLDEWDKLFHELYDDTIEFYTEAGFPPDYELTIPGGGVAAGLEITRPLPGFPFGYGFRADALLLSDLTSRFRVATSTSTSTQDYTLGFSVIRVFAGGYAKAFALGPVRIRGDLWAGWALLSVDWSTRETYTNTVFPAWNSDDKGAMVLTGGGLALSGEVTAAFPLNRRLEVFVKAGFTYCRIPSAVADKDYDLDGDGDIDFLAGHGVAYDDESLVPYDLTGVSGRAGLQYYF